MKIEGRPFVVVELDFDSFTIPGVCAIRLVLINEFGSIVDVATAVWPSRLMGRFRAEVLDPPASDKILLRLWDQEAATFWGNFSPPYFVLHEKEETRTSLPWTGDRCLGELAVNKERFVALPRKK